MIYVILPAFNEEVALPKVLNEIIAIQATSSVSFKVVVVDDGSKDRTSEIAKSFLDKLDLELITFPQNRGVAEVFRQGFKYACADSKHPAQDVAIVLDSDNTQDPKMMIPMADRIAKGDDLVIASRFEGEGKMIGCPFMRALFSYGVMWILRIIAALPNVKDYSTFYRAYRIQLLQKGFEAYGEKLLDGKGFSVAAGLLLKLGNLTNKISEIPLILRYDLKGGSSGNKIMRTIQGYILLIGDYLKTNRFKDLQGKKSCASHD